MFCYSVLSSCFALLIRYKYCLNRYSTRGKVCEVVEGRENKDIVEIVLLEMKVFTVHESYNEEMTN